MVNFKLLLICIAIGFYFAIRWYFGADWSQGFAPLNGSVNQQLLGMLERLLVIVVIISIIILHIIGCKEINQFEKSAWIFCLFIPFTIYMAVLSDFIDRDLEKAKNEK